jgi:heterodisulfide reductase subunit C
VVHKREVVRILTSLLSKAGLGAYSSYRIQIMCLALLSYVCIDCALCVGSCMMMRYVAWQYPSICTPVVDVFMFND